jgi:hypothetical protein
MSEVRRSEKRISIEFDERKRWKKKANCLLLDFLTQERAIEVELMIGSARLLCR